MITKTAARVPQLHEGEAAVDDDEGAKSIPHWRMVNYKKVWKQNLTLKSIPKWCPSQEIWLWLQPCDGQGQEYSQDCKHFPLPCQVSV